MSEKLSAYKIEYFDQMVSTNLYAKTKRAQGENLFIIAKEQTGGMGTKGRSFSSTLGGIYLSKLSFPIKQLATNTFTIMQGAAAAVCKTLCAFGLTPQIKWPNDIFVNGKKICGILIENSLSGKYVASSIVGIGLNVNNTLPQELTSIATTMSIELKKELVVEDVQELLMQYLCTENIDKAYHQYVGWIGEQVCLLVGNEQLRATIKAVDETGRLCVDVQGKEQKFTAAEVSVLPVLSSDRANS